MTATEKVIPLVLPAQVIERKASRSARVYLTPEEILAVLKAARRRSVRDWAMILLAYRHGLRASEVCSLKLADIDLKAGSISIRRLKGSLSQVQPLYQHRGQPLLDEMSALRAWLRTRPADGSDFLFTSQKGGRLHRSQFFRVFQAVAEAVGLPAEKRHPPLPKALSCVAPGGWKREFGAGQTGTGTSVHHEHDAIRRNLGWAGC